MFRVSGTATPERCAQRVETRCSCGGEREACLHPVRCAEVNGYASLSTQFTTTVVPAAGDAHRQHRRRSWWASVYRKTRCFFPEWAGDRCFRPISLLSSLPFPGSSSIPFTQWEVSFVSRLSYTNTAEISSIQLVCSLNRYLSTDTYPALKYLQLSRLWRIKVRTRKCFCLYSVICWETDKVSTRE